MNPTQVTFLKPTLKNASVADRLVCGFCALQRADWHEHYPVKASDVCCICKRTATKEHGWLDPAYDPPPQDKTLKVQVFYDTRADQPDTGKSYLNCQRCVEELPFGVSPQEYANQQVAITNTGDLQVRCIRHNLNIAVIRMRAIYRQVQ